MTEPEPDILAPLREHLKPPAVPGLHPQDVKCRDAGQELFALVHEWAIRHQLTTTEMHFVISTLQRGHLQAACIAERG